MRAAAMRSGLRGLDGGDPALKTSLRVSVSVMGMDWSVV